jgi:hypothetical protein
MKKPLVPEFPKLKDLVVCQPDLLVSVPIDKLTN